MYAVAFDLVVVTERHHPGGVTQAYTEIGAVLGEHGFRRVQGSLYVTAMTRTWSSNGRRGKCMMPARHALSFTAKQALHGGSIPAFQP